MSRRLGERRGNAAAAAVLYRETEASHREPGARSGAAAGRGERSRTTVGRRSVTGDEWSD